MKVAIVGAGIAGLPTAWSLAKRGVEATLFEQGSILNPLSASGDQHRPARNGDADADREVLPEEGEAMRNLFAPPLARVKDYAILRAITCAYTFAEDLRVLSQPAGKALIVSPRLGHGCKFGVAVGRRVADAVLDGDADRLARWLRAEDVSPRKAA